MTERSTQNEHDNNYNPSHLSSLSHRDQQLVGVAMSNMPSGRSERTTFDHYVDLMHENERLERELDAAVATVLEISAQRDASRTVAAYFVQQSAALQRQLGLLQRQIAYLTVPRKGVA